ncbi:MAG: hypothetical protein PF503_20460, partial [Desulfobacula sp.]|nr:hypothetical protein [Desulfobacula sp.]
MKIKQNEHIKMKIILPVLTFFTFIIIVFLAGVINIQKMSNKENVQQRVKGAGQLFQEYLSTEARFLTAQINIIKENQNFQHSFLLKDREALFKKTKPVFDDLLSQYKITHFYFTDLSRINFLRVHNFEKHSDEINRFTMVKAQKEKTTISGIELDPFGTFTLRVVHPWIIKGKHAGYIELGMEITHIAPSVKKIIDLELIFIIKKSELNQDKWEQGLAMMGKKGNWNLFPDSVVMDSTLDYLPLEIKKQLSLIHEKHSGIISTTPTTT